MKKAFSSSTAQGCTERAQRGGSGCDHCDCDEGRLSSLCLQHQARVQQAGEGAHPFSPVVLLDKRSVLEGRCGNQDNAGARSPEMSSEPLGVSHSRCPVAVFLFTPI